MTLLEPYNLPFAAALVIMLLLAIVQVVGLGDMFGDADLDFDADLDGNDAIGAGPMDGVMTLLGLGRVPFVVWLAAFLLIFAGVGVSVQGFAQGMTGAPLDRWLAAIIAAGASLPVTAILVRPLGAIMPKDETTAITTGALVGRRAHITDGVARQGSPARARVRDHHGQTHHVMVEPHDGSAELHAGEEILLVRRERETFFAQAVADRRLSPQA